MVAPVTSARRPGMRPARRAAVFLLVAAVLVVAYAVVAPLVYAHKGWSEGGPLAYGQPTATAPLDPATPLTEVEQRCLALDGFTDPGSDYRLELVPGTVLGREYYGCYQVRTSDGAVFAAKVVDPQGRPASDAVAKAGGAWRWIGTVKTPLEVGLGGAAIVVVLVLYFLYYRRHRPGAPRPARWWQTPAVCGLAGVVQVLPFTLPFRRRESGARRLRLLYEFVFGWIAFWMVVLFFMGVGDRLSFTVTGFFALAVLFGWLGGTVLLRPRGFGAPDRTVPLPAPPPGTPYPIGGYPSPYPATAYPGASPAAPSSGTAWQPAGAAPTGWAPAAPAAAAPAAAGPAVAPAPAAPTRPPAERFRVTAAGRLPDFADVGGMDALKDELGDTFGRLLAFTDEADAYRIRFNGLLLHGPAGVGKTFVAKATAGEFGLNFLQVSVSDLVSKYVGESAANIEAVFAAAARNVPCLLFFDEFDSVAERRDEGIGEESKRVVNQLLQSLEKWRGVRELVIVAATNLLDRLDPAVVRPGRFDRHIRVDLPDRPARRAILVAQLRGRPVAGDVDLDALADRTEGRTPATISRIVESASLMAFRRATDTGRTVPIEQLDLRAALDGLGGRDRPTVEDWTWDRLILADRTKAELRQVQALVADPDISRAYGVAAPSGLLLTGPPGTGKTTIARVFAAQAGCSFYPMSAADLVSKWVGESEGNVQRLFARARDNAPSIVFLDEVDAIAGARGDTGGSVGDRMLNQLLTEIDGVTEARGVFVMAATNRADIVDPALRRGGRLSRTIEIPLPDQEQRLALLELFSAPMPLHAVDLAAVADMADGLSGADLEALCQQAAVHAMLGARAGAGPPTVRPADFAAAFADRPVTGGAPPDERDLPPAQTGQYL